MERKGKKNPISVYPRLRYTQKKIKFCLQNFFFKKKLVWVQKSFWGWKKHKKSFGAISKILWTFFIVAIQKMLIINFPYMEILWLAFFLTNFFSFLFCTIHRILCQNKRKIFRKFNDTFSAKCIKFVWPVFFHRLSLWNCMISIFGLWRSTRGAVFIQLHKLNQIEILVPNYKTQQWLVDRQEHKLCMHHGPRSTPLPHN